MPALTKARDLRATIKHLSVTRHQHLRGLKLCIVRSDGRIAVNELVRQVLDCVAENFKRTPCLGRDSATM
jgi:hypothetical protein